MNVIFLGPPGAGKGTQAKLLSEKYQILHVSTGDLLREASKNGSPNGERIRQFIKEGKLVPDKVVTDLLAKHLERNETDGFILDGFPRNPSQARALDEVLKNAGLTVDLVVYFETSLKTVLKRLTGRRVCRSCGANYHIQNIPPKVEGRCDRCGGELYQREDDQEQTVLKRLTVYRQETVPLIDYYRSQGKLKVVSGDLPVEAGQKVLQQLFQTSCDRT